MSTRKSCSLLLLVLLTAGSVWAAGPEGNYKAPRNEHGQSDLQGTWNFSSDVPLERPAAFADRKFFTREELEKLRAGREKAFAAIAKVVPVEEVGLAWLDYSAQTENLRTSLIVYPDNGRIPKLVEGVRRFPGIEDFLAALNETNAAPPSALFSLIGGGRKDGPEDLGLSERCLPGSHVPLVPGFDNNYMQIVQTRDYAVLLSEARAPRIISLDSKPYSGERLRSWSGDSRGRWEGETLVVETRKFNRRTRSFAGAGNSYDKVVIERFTRVSDHALEYEATIVDPKTFQDRIVMSFPMAKVDARIYEAACHEGNYSLPMTLAGARKAERDRLNTK
jgi:hypothetical protein